MFKVLKNGVLFAQTNEPCNCVLYECKIPTPWTNEVADPIWDDLCRHGYKDEAGNVWTCENAD